MDTGDSKKKQGKKAKKEEKGRKSGFRWAIQVFFISVTLSAVMGLASDQALDGAGLPLAFAVLASFILLGIVFDIIGVAVTAADERPFHSMAAHKTPGAREALGLIRRASKVSSFCNDVVGDICGIISGSTGAIIVTRLQEAFSFRSVVVSLAITALVSGLTIGGKAVGKMFAIEKSTAVLQLVGRILHLFSGKK